MQYFLQYNKLPLGFDFEPNADSLQYKGLVAWYPVKPGLFNAVKPSLVSTFGNNAQIVVTEMGKVLDFDGTDDYVAITKTPNIDFTTGSLSAMCWLNARAASENRIMNDRGRGGVYQGWQFKIANSGAGWKFHDSAVANGTSYQAQFSDATVKSFNIWYHVAFVYDSTSGAQTIKVYANGLLQDTASFSGMTSISNALPLELGATNYLNGAGSTTEQELNGQITDVRIYNRALSQFEILSMYKPDTRWELYKPLYRNWQGFVSTSDQTVTLNFASASSTGNQIVASPGNFTQTVNNAIASSIGNNLVTHYTQIISNTVASAVGNDLSYVAGNLDITINKADSSAVGLSLVSHYTQIIDSAIASGVGYQITPLPGNITRTVNKTDASAIGYILNATTNTIAAVNLTNASASGYVLDSHYIQQINKAVATALGNNLNFTAGAIIVTINKANANATGYNVSPTDFIIILSAERIYIVKPDNRTYIALDDRTYIPFENRILKVN